MIYKFNEFKLLELHKHQNDNELEGKIVLLYQGDLWIFNSTDYNNEKLYDKFNQILNVNLFKEDADDSDIRDYFYGLIDEEKLNILCGYITYNELELFVYPDFIPAEQSTDLNKLYKELNIPIFYINNDNTPVYLFPNKEKIQNVKCYHGTSINYLNSILKFGLKPTDKSNYGIINHTDKIFFSTNIYKAKYHAEHSAEIQESYPIIIEFKIPDTDKVLPDFDLANIAYGANSDIIKKLKYNSSMTYTGDPTIKHNIENKYSVFGYLGRIPAVFITNIIINPDWYTNFYYDTSSIDYGRMSYDEDFNNINNWQSFKPNEINDYLDNLIEYEEEDYDEDDN
jgi:hypothetical protein